MREALNIRASGRATTCSKSGEPMGRSVAKVAADRLLVHALGDGRDPLRPRPPPRGVSVAGHPYPARN
jgi:hypothetical protein